MIYINLSYCANTNKYLYSILDRLFDLSNMNNYRQQGLVILLMFGFNKLIYIEGFCADNINVDSARLHAYPPMTDKNVQSLECLKW